MNLLESGVSLNIVILPNQEVAAKAVKFSNAVAAQVDTEFILDEDHSPHITAFQGHFPERNIDKIKEVLKYLAEKTSPFQVQMDEFQVRYTNFVFWNCVKSIRLQNLHEGVVEAVNPLREGLILPHLETISGLSEVDQQDRENFGALLIGPRYEPHITITRTKNEQGARKAEKILGIRRQEVFTAHQLELWYLGLHGTVTERIAEYPFGNRS